MASRSRRRPHGKRAAAQQRRRSFPTPVLLLGAGALAVAAVIAFVVLQAGGASDSEDFVAAEADASTALPGEWVDLPGIYGGPYPETGGHVRVAVDYETDGNSNPPAGGPHWSGGCGEDPAAAPAFCGPAPWGVFRAPWAPETLVHNMEHGGVVVWYNTTDQKVIDELEELVIERLEDGDLVVMAPYPGMEDDHVAVTAWSRIDKFPAGEFDVGRVGDFIEAHVRRFNPEHF